jgi:membrane protein
MFRKIYDTSTEIYFSFVKHNGPMLGAGIAFFTFLSFFPLLLFVAIVFGYYLEDQALRDQILNYVFSNIPALGDLVRGNIESLIEGKSNAGIIAVLALLWSGIGVFGGLSVSLNAAYEVTETRSFFVQKSLALLAFILVIGLILVSFATTTLAGIFRDNVLVLILKEPTLTYSWTVLSNIIGVVSTFLLFFVVYKLAPNVRLNVKHIWLGTVVAGILWEAAKRIFALYLNAFAFTSYGFVYGSLAVIVLFLFWLYISAILLLLGAEINVAYRKRLTGGVKVFEPRKSGK